MSGVGWTRLLKEARKRGYEISICFVAINNVEIAIERVASRVEKGGHDIPVPTIERRFKRSLSLFFEKYQELCDFWYLFDNSNSSALLIAKREHRDRVDILEEDI